MRSSTRLYATDEHGRPSGFGISKTAAGRVAAALATETGLARIALGVGALHVVDDNFLQPEPGVSARDHLWGGLVQVALLVAFAWGYPRLRPGLRGILAVYVGIFMIVMGAGEAGYYTREDGLPATTTPGS